MFKFAFIISAKFDDELAKWNIVNAQTLYFLGLLMKPRVFSASSTISINTSVKRNSRKNKFSCIKKPREYILK